MGCAAIREMRTSFIQAESSVDGEADFRRVLVFLAIVLPPADRTQRQCGCGRQRLISTAWTSKTKRQDFPHVFGRERGIWGLHRVQLPALGF